MWTFWGWCLTWGCVCSCVKTLINQWVHGSLSNATILMERELYL